jgi:hypothetical protein
MKNYTEEEVLTLIERFEVQQLPKSEWTHEAHLVVAIWYCSKYSFEQAVELVRMNITKHNESVGTPNTDTEGYHETITKFWLLTATQFLSTQRELPIHLLCNDFINSDKAHSSFPLEFYSREQLFSVEARHNWIEPDLKDVR